MPRTPRSRLQLRRLAQMKLLFTKEGLRRKIMTDPDDEPTAGNVPTREQQLEHALIEMMSAYQRRVLTDCTTPEQRLAAPWRCMEYIAAEELLKVRE